MELTPDAVLNELAGTLLKFMMICTTGSEDEGGLAEGTGDTATTVLASQTVSDLSLHAVLTT